MTFSFVQVFWWTMFVASIVVVVCSVGIAVGLGEWASWRFRGVIGGVILFGVTLLSLIPLLYLSTNLCAWVLAHARGA